MTITANFKTTYGPWAIVTGAASGIGLEFSNQLAAQGLQIIAVDIQEELLKKQVEYLQEKYGIEALGVVIDLSQADFLERLVEATGEREVGLLANVAGLGSVRDFM